MMSRQVILDKKTGSRITINTRDNIDMAVVKQIFLRHDYNLKSLSRCHDIQAQYDQILATGYTPLIIDAGANIGASCLYFANEFPEARVIGIEPESGNHRIATDNCNGHPNINILRAGLASTTGRARIDNKGADNWAFQTKVDTQGDLPLVSINTLIEDASSQKLTPFLVKIDVEGFEENIFASNTEWIDQFYILIIELHDWMLPGQANSRHFLQSIAPLGRDFVYRTENIFSIQN